MPERYSLKTLSKWFWLFHQIEQARLRLSGTTTTWKVPIELNGNIWCLLLKGYRALICDEHGFLLYRFIGLYTTKMKAELTAILYPERSRCAPVLSVYELVVTFHWCSVYIVKPFLTRKMFHLGILRLQLYLILKDFQYTLAIYKLKRHTRREITASDVVGWIWIKSSLWRKTIVCWCSFCTSFDALLQKTIQPSIKSSHLRVT